MGAVGSSSLAVVDDTVDMDVAGRDEWPELGGRDEVATTTDVVDRRCTVQSPVDLLFRGLHLESFLLLLEWSWRALLFPPDSGVDFDWLLKVPLVLGLFDSNRPEEEGSLHDAIFLSILLNVAMSSSSKLSGDRS